MTPGVGRIPSTPWGAARHCWGCSLVATRIQPTIIEFFQVGEVDSPAHVFTTSPASWTMGVISFAVVQAPGMHVALDLSGMVI